ncbi:hypothetical protein K523DRAFT_324689 [Schizophyllum commune Tattone D]|nr:hypothetical protein K523DRAFT_324689 [Schizophyllum commune Tattone D]
MLASGSASGALLAPHCEACRHLLSTGYALLGLDGIRLLRALGRRHIEEHICDRCWIARTTLFSTVDCSRC